MDKRLIYPQNSANSRDAYFVQEDKKYLQKHASAYHPLVQKYIDEAKPLPGLVQVLLTALGAGEHWNYNVNGDFFPAAALSHEGDDYGYKTFVTNAHYFNHHVNSNPALAKGKVLHTVWNEKAKRVELVVGIDIEKDPDAVTAIDRGENLTFSMGSKVPFDICSICSNKARTRAEYCDHLRYQMGQIDPLSGKPVYAINTLPKFFDISRVLIPADKTAYMWEKIASAGAFSGLSSALLADLPAGKISDIKYLEEKVAEVRDHNKIATRKSAMVSKDAAIVKRIPATTDFDAKLTDSFEHAKALDQKMSPSIKKEDLDKIYSIATLDKILSTMYALGIDLKADEAPSILKDQTPESISALDVGPNNFDPAVAAILAGYFEDRSCARPVLTRRIVTLANKLDSGDPAVKKAAAEIREEHGNDKVGPAFMAGLLAAMYALGRDKPVGIVSKMGELISAHPFLSMLLGTMAYKAHEVLSKPTTAGMISVDPTTEGLYNSNWQSRFARMQARPVTVIKTGSAKAGDKLLAKKLFVGVPAIWLTSRVMKAKQDAEPHKRHGLVSRFVANNPEAISYGLVAEHLMGRPVEKRVKNLFQTSKNIIKNASVQNLDFLESVPESEQDIVWDIAILDAASRIRKQITGG